MDLADTDPLAALPEREATAGPEPAAPSCGPEEALSCLLTVTHDLSSAPDLDTGLRRVADDLRRFIPFDSLAILLLDDLGRELRFALALGYSEEIVEHWRFGRGQGLVGTAAASGEVVRADDVTEDPRHIDAGDGARAEIAVPLVTKGRTIGVLDLGSETPGFFDTDHERLLRFLAGHLAAAIENARLHQNTVEQARSLSLLHELGRELSSILDRRELLERVADRLGRFVDYDLFAVLLWCEDTETLDPWIALHRDGRELDWYEGVPLGHGICGTAAALRQSVRVPNVQIDPRFVSCSPSVEVASELAVPLLFEGRLLGVINLESTHYDAFSARDEELLSTLSTSIAIALENARLYERSRADERRLQQDLEMAREIQRRLLPDRSPWIPGVQLGVGYEPARHLGGDFYDFFRYSEGQVGIAVGDVAGKATPAALYGSLAIGMLREYADQCQCDPAKVLRDLNHKLVQLGIRNRFLSMVYAVYEPEPGTVSIASSGLPYPYLVRDGEVEILDVAGVPLGLLPDRSYDQLEVPLRPGDALVICSDGIEESLDPGEEELGRDRVREAIARLAGGSAGEIAQGLLDEAKRWSAGAEASDDRTVVILRIAGEDART